MMDYRVAIATIAFASLMGGTAQTIFKTAVQPLNLFRLSLGFGLYGIAFIIYLVALRSVPVSIGYPIIALSYIVVAVMSYWFLNEPWTISKTVGSIGLVACIWLIAR